MNNTEKSGAVRQSSVKSKPESKIWKFLKLPHKKTVYFIGEITVKIDSRGIYSLENINYHDAYLNISVIATCQPSFVDRSGAPNVANHLHMFGRPSGALPFTTRALRRIQVSIPTQMRLDQPHFLHFSFDPLVDLGSRRTERKSEIQLHHAHLSQSDLYRDRIHISKHAVDQRLHRKLQFSCPFDISIQEAARHFHRFLRHDIRDDRYVTNSAE